jgi:hypothetical protein
MEYFSASDSVAAMTGCDQMIQGFMDEIITGMNCGDIVALLQSNFGLNVASQGYPNKISSLPMSVMRKRISL